MCNLGIGELNLRDETKGIGTRSWIRKIQLPVSEADWRTLGLGGGAAYLTRLNAVDEDGVWVPLPPPSAHDALRGRWKNRKQKQRALVSKRRGKSWAPPTSPTPLPEEGDPGCAALKGPSPASLSCGSANPASRSRGGTPTLFTLLHQPSEVSKFPRGVGVILESILNVVMTLIWF